MIDEVRKHWAALVGAVLELTGGLLVAFLSVLVPVEVWWLPFAVGAALSIHAGWRILERRLDRFVITNMRVFRVHGILSQRIATMPLARILDISVHKPFIGRILGYGHFVFESAAQEQGLREIRFVGDPDGRGITIQRVIAQSGLRGAIQATGAPPAAPASAPVEGAVDAAPQAPSAPLVPESAPIPPRPPLPASRAGWDWLADAQQREQDHLSRLRGEEPGRGIPPFDPDRTPTAPIPTTR
ncbi:PH domain-containing protein [Microbacterium sp. SS28]|uniref:PH domain-containing protein n=1 Tax=Microbacterium sp. SS28 TaxID=2919948 RepID=UPI001FAA00D9|nr:PH domain-containing protein [Microbacterium sp. SS28]